MLYTLYLMLFCHFFLYKGYFLHQIQSKTGLKRSTIEMINKEMYRDKENSNKGCLSKFSLFDNKAKIGFLEHISNCLECNRVGNSVVDKVSGLNSIIKLFSDNLINNKLFIIRR